MLLGIDISTTITAFTILDEDGKILLCESVRLEKIKDVFDKVKTIKKYLEKIKTSYKIEKVFIEESLLSFQGGASSAKTIATLTKFNGIVSWLCVDIFKNTPEFLSAATARKSYGVARIKGRKAKEVAFESVLDKEDGFSVEYTAHGNPVPGSKDRSDSLIIARAGYLKWKSLKS